MAWVRGVSQTAVKRCSKVSSPVEDAVELFKATGTVAEMRGDMIDVSQFGDVPGSRHIAGAIDVDVFTGAGVIPIRWQGAAPKIGDRVTITIESA